MPGFVSGGISEANLDAALLAALPAITDGHALLGTGTSGDAGAAIKTAAKALGKQIRAVHVQKGDATGDENYAVSAFTETSLQISVTATAADSVLLGFMVARLTMVDASSTASRRAQFVIRKDSTAGEGGAANGSNVFVAFVGRDLVTASTTDAAAYQQTVAMWTGTAGDTNAHTFTLCVAESTSVTITYENSNDFASIFVVLELEP